MQRPLPQYRALLQAYPDKHKIAAKALLDAIGGEVRRSLSDAVNTCALRMSYCLNVAGQKIRRMPGLYELPGARSPLRSPAPARSDLYVIRAKEMKQYLDVEYGRGTLIYDAARNPKEIVNLQRQTQGVIVFDWEGRPRDFGAGGHVDLFRLWPSGDNLPRLEPACFGECFWWTIGGPMKAYLWETLP